MTKMNKIEKMVLAANFVAELDTANMTEELKKTHDFVVDFLNKELEALKKKAERKTDGKTAQVNNGIQKNILTVLAEHVQPMTVAELIKVEILSTYEEEKKGEKIIRDMSGQKMSALLKKLKDSGTVARIEKERRAYFYLPEVWSPEKEEETEE